MGGIKYILLFFFLCFAVESSAQSALGIAFNINNDFVKIEDNGNEIIHTPRINVSVNGFYKYTFKKGFHVSAGLSLKHFKESTRFRSSTAYYSSTGNMVAQLPVLFGKNFYVYPDKFYVSPVIGGTFNMLLLYKSASTGGGGLGQPGDTLSYRYYTVDAQEYFVTLNLGLQLGYHLSRSFSVVVFSRYNAGFKPVSRQFITYHHNSITEKKAVQTINGSYLTVFGAGIYYTFKRKAV
jgi:hypothetical protein